MIDEDIKVKGKVAIQVFDKDGNVKDERLIDNLVVTLGKSYIASRIVGTATAVMSHMAIGAGSVAAVVDNTVLGSELARQALSGATSLNHQASFSANYIAGIGTGAITEAGLFNAASAGTMMCRTVFSVVNKGVDDSMSITWTITISSAA